MENSNSSFRRLLRNLRKKRSHEKIVHIGNPTLLSKEKESKENEIPSQNDNNYGREWDGQIMPD